MDFKEKQISTDQLRAQALRTNLIVIAAVCFIGSVAGLALDVISFLVEHG